MSSRIVRERVEAESGDVFVDLGFADPMACRLRVRLAMQVNDLIAGHGLTQSRAAKMLEIARPQLSELRNYRLGRFPAERLLHFLTRLGCDVHILIRPKAKARRAGQLRVSVPAN